MADRISQIAMCAHRVAPAGVGAWRSTSRTSPSVSVVVAPADLAYLIHLARAADRAKAERNGLWNRMVALADEWTALAADLMYASVERGEPGLHERGTTYGAAANTIRRTLTGENNG